MKSLESNPLFLQVINTDHLPTLPEVAKRLIEIAQKPDPHVRDVCQVIKSDPAISCKILKTVNSALFAFRPRVETIEQAVPKLGNSLIRTLILNFHLSTIRVENSSFEKVFQKAWKSCLTQAVMAELLAERSGKDSAFCFMAGMLQDIGILAMLNEFPDRYVNHVLANSELPDVVAAEREHFGFSHVQVANEILNRWNLSPTFSRIVKNHHHRFAFFRAANASIDDAVIMQAANLGTELILGNKNRIDSIDNEINQWFGFLGTHFDFDEQSAEDLLESVIERVNEYSIVFDFDIGTPIETNRIIAEAKDMLHEIALNNQLNQLTKAVHSEKQKPEQNELYYDCLTRLFNRRFLNEVLGQRIEGWLQAGQSVAFMFIDADNFKSINDNFGHARGDAAIVHIANWLNQCTRGSDYVIRLGGDEFLVVMQIEENHLKQIAERIGNQIPPLKLDDGSEQPMSLSAGCVFHIPDGRKSPDVNLMIEQADQLMYRIKKQGGANCFVHRLQSKDIQELELAVGC